jgi:arylsulfatase A
MNDYELSRRHFLGLLGAAGALSAMPASAQTSRPNIILIMADDIGVDGFSCYGSASYQTPRLDEIASTGVRFTHCYSQPLCTPSRVQIMTGQANFRNYFAFGALSPTDKTFAHMLKDDGYDTCVVGKWQLAGRNTPEAGPGSTPEQAGFDDYCLWQIHDRGKRYADPEIVRKGEPLKEMTGEYGPDVFTDYLIDFISKPRENPFLAYFPMALVHNPFVPTPDSPEWSEDRHMDRNRFIVDMVAYMDKLVGRIADKLDELGIADNTLLMFTSDNGTNRKIKSEMQDGRTIEGAKGLPTNAGTHVPLIARWRGVTPEGKVCDDLVSFDDFMPTMAAASGAALPDDRVIDGQSFLPQLRGGPGNPREYVICYYDPRWGGRESVAYARDKRFKLYQSGEFYDVQSDPLEQNPIVPGTESDDARKARQKLADALSTIPPVRTGPAQ